MGACMSGPKQTSAPTATSATATRPPSNQNQNKTPTPPVSVAPPASAQLANRPPSSNSSPNRTAQSASNSPPQSVAATPNANTPLVTSFQPLPTIPTLISPLNNRVLPSTPPSEDDREAASEEVSRAPDEDESKGGESIAVAMDANAHSGGDVAYSFWQHIAKPQRDLTFRPSQPPVSGRGGNQRLGQTIKATMRATLGGGDIQDTVKLPDGEDLNEWIAVNTSDTHTNTHKTQTIICSINTLHHHSCRLPLASVLIVRLLWSRMVFSVCQGSLLQRRLHDMGHLLPVLHTSHVPTHDGRPSRISMVSTHNKTTLHCTTCSESTGRRDLLTVLCLIFAVHHCRKDDTVYKKPTQLPACQYIELLLNWIDLQISDSTIFPVDEGTRFPRSFQSTVRNIYKRLFRLYAHLYCTHSDKVRSIGANAHLNTVFKHYMYFSEEFGLIDESDKQPLARLILKMRENDSRENKYR